MIEQEEHPKAVTIAQIRQLLKSFESEDGRYKTIELINFLNGFVFNESKDDAFYQAQIFLNMSKIFGNNYDEHNLLDLLSNSTYIPANNDQLQNKVLFEIFNRHLQKESHISITQDNKEKEFKSFMESMRNKIVSNVFNLN